MPVQCCKRQATVMYVQWWWTEALHAPTQATLEWVKQWSGWAVGGLEEGQMGTRLGKGTFIEVEWILVAHKVESYPLSQPVFALWGSSGLCQLAYIWGDPLIAKQPTRWLLKIFLLTSLQLLTYKEKWHQDEKNNVIWTGQKHINTMTFPSIY